MQMMLAVIDPEGVARRKSRRLKRRVYQNKVVLNCRFAVL